VNAPSGWLALRRGRQLEQDGRPKSGLGNAQNADAVATEIFMPDSPCRGMQRLVNIADKMKQEFEGEESLVVSSLVNWSTLSITQSGDGAWLAA